LINTAVKEIKLNIREKNKMLIKNMNLALLKGNSVFVLVHLAEDFRWNIVGMPQVIVKKDFLETVTALALQNFNIINITNIIAEEDYVVVESTGKPYTPSYCDIYRVREDKIQSLTTYVVDTSLIA